MPNELVKIEPGELQVCRPMDLLQLAVERGASVDTIERMMAVRRELRAEKAKEEFDRAMAEFQAKCPIIEKTKFGAKNSYKYAPLDEIVSKTKDLMSSLGLSYGLTSVTDGDWVTAKLTVKHNAGHFEQSEFRVPIDKQNNMMTPPQRHGGAMTFAKRYAFCNAFGILTGDEDTDSHGAPPKPAGPNSLAGTSVVNKEETELKKKLIIMTREIHGCPNFRLNDDQKQKLEQFLIDENYISDTEILGDLGGKRLAEVVARIAQKAVQKEINEKQNELEYKAFPKGA